MKWSWVNKLEKVGPNFLENEEVIENWGWDEMV